MNYYTIPPPIHLKPYIRCFWVLEHDFEADEDSYIYRSIADSCVEIVFHYRAAFNEIVTEGQAHNLLSGINFQSIQYRRFETKQSFGIFGAYIYPFAVPYFFKVPSDKTSNELLDLETFLGTEGKELEEKIMIAPNNCARVEILTDFFEKKLLNSQSKDDTIIVVIRHIIDSGLENTVAQLANRFNLSTRQLDRKFKESAGFNPKTYLRLVRFRNAIKQHGVNKSLTQIALDCGYYDQSHFIHDVRTFTGYSPSHYFSGNAEGTEYKYV